MPSRVSVAEDNGSLVDIVPSEEAHQAVADVTADKKVVDQRKITPITDKKKNTSPKKKGKQQMTLSAFFTGTTGTKKTSPTPTTTTTKKYQQGNAKKASVKPAEKAKNIAKPNQRKSTKASKTAVTNKTPAASKKAPSKTSTTDIHKGRSHTKMGFKEIVIGNLTKRTPTDESNLAIATPCTTPATGKKENLNALPKIPSLKMCFGSDHFKQANDGPLETDTDCKVTASKVLDLISGSSPNGSDDSNAGMGAVRSQLFPKFENPPKEEIVENNSSGPEINDADSNIDMLSPYANKLEEPLESTEKSLVADESPTEIIETVSDSDPMIVDQACGGKTIIVKESKSASNEGEDDSEIIDNQNKTPSESPSEAKNNDVSSDMKTTNLTTTDQLTIEVAKQSPFKKSECNESPKTTSMDGEQKNSEKTPNTPTRITSVTEPATESHSEQQRRSVKKALAKLDNISPKKENSFVLSPESQELLRKHEALRDKHQKKAKTMVEQAQQGLSAEHDSLSMPSTEGIEISSGSPTEFPDAAIPHLLSIVEGSDLPLSALGEKICRELNCAFSVKTFTPAVVTGKVKILANRKATIKNPGIANDASVSNSLSSDKNSFEDVESRHMWRWEAISLDLVPDYSVKTVKAARSARRKLQQKFNATAKLLGALQDSIKLLLEAESQPSQGKVDKLIARVSKEEEKVLKYEQEAEKARLAAEAKKQKAQLKKQKMKADKDRQKEEKQRAAEERKLEEEKRKREKDEAKREKDEAKKRKFIEKEQAKKEKEEKEREEQRKKQEASHRNKKRMMSFFGGPQKKKAKQSGDRMSEIAASTATEAFVSHQSDFDSEKFWSIIDRQEQSVDAKAEFRSVSKRAARSRTPKAKRIEMRVFVSGQCSDDPFAAQPVFAEERIVQIRDRRKFLKFEEDHRPPYHGTWSKRSKAKNLGRKPFSKEPCLDYDVDSEAEWEEGDDDPGEDVENDVDDEEDKIMDEEGDTRVYNYKDGWLAEDDEIENEDGDLDEDTKKLRANRKRCDGQEVPVCIVAPAFGGRPLFDEKSSHDESIQGRVIGFPVKDARELVLAHNATELNDASIFLDSFPPVLVEDREKALEPPASTEPSQDDLKTIACFVHHSVLASKPQIVEELRNLHPSVTASKAQAHRILDSMADKKRHPSISGVYWEVKPEMICKLGLSDELKPKEIPIVEEAAKKESKKRKNSDSLVSSEPKKKKVKSNSSPKKTQVPEGSAKLLAAFLKKHN